MDGLRYFTLRRILIPGNGVLAACNTMEEGEGIITNLPANLGLIRCLVPHEGASQRKHPF
jgi:hypothetical protein